MEIWEEMASNPKVGAERLVAEYGNRLFTAAFQITQHAADAEDLVFRTFARVVERGAGYAGPPIGHKSAGPSCRAQRL